MESALDVYNDLSVGDVIQVKREFDKETTTIRWDSIGPPIIGSEFTVVEIDRTDGTFRADGWWLHYSCL